MKCGKSSMYPSWAYFVSELPEEGLKRGGGLFTKLSDKDIFDSFSVLLSHILQNQHTISRFNYIHSTQVDPKPF